MSQKGLATTTLTGTGSEAYVAVITDGNPIALSNVQSHNTISVDPDAVICWMGNGACDPRITTDVNWKTFIGQASGESYSFEWHGGIPVTVIIQPLNAAAVSALQSIKKISPATLAGDISKSALFIC